MPPSRFLRLIWVQYCLRREMKAVDQPRAINKRSEPALIGGCLLVIDGILAADALIRGAFAYLIPVALIALIAIVLICFCVKQVILDENGICFVRLASATRYSWEDVKQVGIGTQQLRYGTKTGVLVLQIKGRKKVLPYTKKNMACIRAYYGAPDYDRWGKEPNAR